MNKILLLIISIFSISALAQTQDVKDSETFKVSCHVYGQDAKNLEIVTLFKFNTIIRESSFPTVVDGKDSCIPVVIEKEIVGFDSIKFQVTAYKCMTNDIYFAQNLSLDEYTASAQVGEEGPGGFGRIKIKKDKPFLVHKNLLNFVNSDCTINK